jgi:AcrR family transcriptional regulator
VSAPHVVAAEAAPAHPTRPRRGRSRASVTGTRERIITATLDALAHNGYAGTTARVIASSAGVPVGLIFYHFGTLDTLLLAVLDHTSAARLPQWEEALAEVSHPVDLMRIMGELYAEDMASGHAVAVRELVSNGGLSARLGKEMAVRMEPWFALAEGVAARVLHGSPVLGLIPARDLAVTAVALYLGLDVVSRLAGTSTSAAALVSAGERLAPLLGRLSTRDTATSRRPRRIALD